MTPLRLFCDDAKNAAAKTREPCIACGSEQMQLMNGHDPLEHWTWRCRMCRTTRAQAPHSPSGRLPRLVVAGTRRNRSRGPLARRGGMEIDG